MLGRTSGKAGSAALQNEREPVGQDSQGSHDSHDSHTHALLHPCTCTAALKAFSQKGFQACLGFKSCSLFTVTS